MFAPAALVLALASTPARAGDVLEPPGLVEIVPVAEAITDGATPVRFHVLALRPDGTPYTGLELSPGSRAGVASGWEQVQAGLYAFTWMPPRATRAEVADVFLKGRTPDKERLSPSTTMVLREPMATALSVGASPERLVVGRDDDAALTFRFDPDTGPVRPDQLVVSATGGRLVNLSTMGQGEFRARLEIDDRDHPGLALVTVADARQPTRSYGSVAVPLVVQREQRLQGPPGASVLVQVAGKEHGPVELDSRGRGAVELTLPPGVDKVKQVSVLDGEITESELDLELPPVTRLRFLPHLPTLPGDSGLEVPVRVVVFEPDGSRDDDAELTITASAGQVGEPRHEGDGVYAVDYVPDDALEAGEVRFQALLGDGDEPADELVLPVVPVRPASVAVEVRPDPMPAGADSATAVVTVRDPGGAGLAGREVRVSAVGARVQGEVEDRGDGTYQVELEPLGAGPIEVQASVRSLATDNPMRQLVLTRLDRHLPADGLSTNLLGVVALDEYGYPVAGADVGLEVVSGGGSLPEQVVTDEHGAGQVYYTAGREPGLVRVAARAGDHLALTAFLQGPPVLGEVPVPPSGTEEQRELVRAWSELAVEERVERR